MNVPMRPSLARRAARAAFRLAPWLLAAASSCSTGSGSTSLLGPSEYPKDQAVPAAAALRVTRPALDFVAQVFPGLAKTLLGSALDADGVYWVDVPTSTSTGVTICPDGPDPNAQPPECRAEVDISHADLHLDPTNPNLLVISGGVPIRLKNLPVKAVGFIPFGIGLGTNASCDGNTPNVDQFSVVDVDIRLPLVAETIEPRTGVMRIDGKNATVKVTLNESDLMGCLLNFDISWILQLASSTIVGTLESTIQEKLAGALCTAPDPAKDPPCPQGSQPDDPDPAKATKCMFDADPTTCVGPLFGIEGRLDAGALLKAYSPGTRSLTDLMIAAWGPMDPAPGLASTGPKGTDKNYTPNGMTIGLAGGMLPATSASCLVPVDNPPPKDITVLEALRADTWPGETATYDLGIGVAGRFLTYALRGIYNSGLLCARVSTEAMPLVNTGLLSLLVPSIRALSLEEKPAAAVIATRPTNPLELKLGTGADVDSDALLNISITDLYLDFYVWSYDRFVRAMTVSADVAVGVNLEVQTDSQTQQTSIVPVIGNPRISGLSVSNSELLLENPEAVATATQGLIGQFLGEIGALAGINVSTVLASYGLELKLRPDSIRTMIQGNDDYLVVLANLASLPQSTSLRTPYAASAALLGKRVDPGAMGLGTLSPDKLPAVHLAVQPDPAFEGETLEYAFEIDHGPRTRWSAERDVWLSEPALALQGKHEVQLLARAAGRTETTTHAGAAIRFAIDVLGPQVSLKRDGSRAVLKAWDFVSDTSKLQARSRIVGADGQGAWGAWAPLSQSTRLDVPGTGTLAVEVRDEEGNTTAASLDTADAAAQAASGCGCSTPGSSRSPAGLAFALGLLATAAGVRRRRGRGVKPAACAAVACAAAVGASLVPGCGDGQEYDSYTGCGADCHRGCQPSLPKGIIGAYTSVAVSGDSIWVAGYNDRGLANGSAWAYGDLVAGQYDRETGLVRWATVDGMPAARTDGVCPNFDPAGWRGGEPLAGPDVGLWTSMQVASDGTPMIAYYDLTNRSLRFAHASGGGWNSYVLASGAGADVGRYAKMVLQNGVPVVAFLWLERSPDGHTLSRIQVARATAEIPGEGDWQLSVAAEETAGTCTQSLCAAGETCIAATGVCTAADAACPCDGGACYEVDGSVTCAPATPAASEETWPNAIGNYLSVASGPQGLGMVAWDRVHGALIGIRETSGGFEQFVVDQPADPAATPAPGLGASLAIGADGAWNVSYGDDVHAAVHYVRVEGTAPGTPEVVDDGSAIDGVSGADLGRWIGDDTTLSVDDAGKVMVFYQDATAGVLRAAIGTPSSGGGHDWVRSVMQQPAKFAGFFPQALPLTREVANFWRSVEPGDHERGGDVSILPWP